MKLGNKQSFLYELTVFNVTCVQFAASNLAANFRFNSQLAERVCKHSSPLSNHIGSHGSLPALSLSLFFIPHII